ncbi:hypothetical protein RSAG8_09447, partial [Rhizoctonia solani AG-8 WAC10335]
MSADPPAPQTNHERFRHWITDVQVTPGNSDPNFKFSARLFVDVEHARNVSESWPIVTVILFDFIWSVTAI